MDILLIGGRQFLTLDEEQVDVIKTGLARNIENYGKDKDGNPARNLHPAVQRRGLEKLKALAACVKVEKAIPNDSMSLHLASRAIEQCIDDGSLAFDGLGGEQSMEERETTAIRAMHAELMLDDPVFADISQPPERHHEA